MPRRLRHAGLRQGRPGGEALRRPRLPHQPRHRVQQGPRLGAAGLPSRPAHPSGAPRGAQGKREVGAHQLGRGPRHHRRADAGLQGGARGRVGGGGVRHRARERVGGLPFRQLLRQPQRAHRRPLLLRPPHRDHGDHLRLERDRRLRQQPPLHHGLGQQRHHQQPRLLQGRALLPGAERRGQAHRDRPAPDPRGGPRRHLAAAAAGHRHRPGAGHGQRDRAGGALRQGVRRGLHARLGGVQGPGGRVSARAGGGDHLGAQGEDRRSRPPLRHHQTGRRAVGRGHRAADHLRRQQPRPPVPHGDHGEHRRARRSGAVPPAAHPQRQRVRRPQSPAPGAGREAPGGRRVPPGRQLRHHQPEVRVGRRAHRTTVSREDVVLHQLQSR